MTSSELYLNLYIQTAGLDLVTDGTCNYWKRWPLRASIVRVVIQIIADNAPRSLLVAS